MAPKTYIFSPPAATGSRQKGVSAPTADDRLRRLLPERHDVSTLLVACRADSYSASEVARAVEDCDAHLLNLNVTADTTADGRALVELRVTHTNPASISRSLERYGYETIATEAPYGSIPGEPGADADPARSRALEALRYINV